jgi:antitoxin component YwqK of YwqJK toxin-antitoxin module
MTREQHLVFCRRCVHREMNDDHGIICSLTGMIADFTSRCEQFKDDPSAPNHISEEEVASSEVPINLLHEDLIKRLKQYEDFNYAIVGGIFTMIVCSILWAMISVAAEMQIGYMALGVGLLVGFAVRFFGAGISLKFAYLGAGLSLAGCLLGNLFTQVGFTAKTESLGYFEVTSYLTPSFIIQIMADSFQPIDLLFYFLAILEGYRFSVRKLTVAVTDRLVKGDSGAPKGVQLRLPLVIAGIIAISVVIFKLSSGVSGEKIFYYDSGEVMSRGELKNGKATGLWTFLFENGKTMAEGSFTKGKRNGDWKWYSRYGNLLTKGTYKYGVYHGVFINYYESGGVQDSGEYVKSRLQGYWIGRYENGQLSYSGYYNRNQPDSLWVYYADNGMKTMSGRMIEGEMRGIWLMWDGDGRSSGEIEYMGNEIIRLRNVVDKNNLPMIVDGNGEYISRADDGTIFERGMVKNGCKTGIWKSFYSNGKIHTSGEYIDEVYYLREAWDYNGNKLVDGGNGVFDQYTVDIQTRVDSGEYREGLREGLWKIFSTSTGNPVLICNYHGGKLNGRMQSYTDNGELATEGNMVSGKREGEWIWYFEGGVPSSRATFVSNKKEGTQSIYCETGELVGEEEYKNGELVSEWYEED